MNIQEQLIATQYPNQLKGTLKTLSSTKPYIAAFLVFTALAYLGYQKSSIIKFIATQNNIINNFKIRMRIDGTTEVYSEKKAKSPLCFNFLTSQSPIFSSLLQCSRDKPEPQNLLKELEIIAESFGNYLPVYGKNGERRIPTLKFAMETFSRVLMNQKKTLTQKKNALKTVMNDYLNDNSEKYWELDKTYNVPTAIPECVFEIMVDGNDIALIEKRILVVFSIYHECIHPFKLQGSLVDEGKRVRSNSF